LGRCAEAAGALGGPAAAPLVERVARYAEGCLEDVPARRVADHRGGPVWWPASTLVLCARAAARLGEREAADRAVRRALAGVAHADAVDRAELQQEVLAASALLDEARREALAAEVMTAFRDGAGELDAGYV